VTYHIKAKAKSSGIEACLKVPVTLECDKKTWDLQPTLESPIQIGTTDVRNSSMISKALIRNVEHRKFVPTFRWFAWLSEVLGDLGEELPWSGDASPYCAAPEEEHCGVTGSRSIGVKVNRLVIKVQEDLGKEMEAKLKQVEKKNAETIKKMEDAHKKQIAKLETTVKNMEKTIKDMDKTIKEPGKK
jgi:hypothetical protein